MLVSAMSAVRKKATGPLEAHLGSPRTLAVKFEYSEPSSPIRALESCGLRCQFEAARREGAWPGGAAIPVVAAPQVAYLLARLGFQVTLAGLTAVPCPLGGSPD